MKRIISLALAVLLCFATLALCSCNDKLSAQNDVDKVKKATVLKVGMECAYAPYNWTQLDDSNDAVKISNAEGYANGYDVQIAKKLADSLGVKLEVYAYEWGALVPAVESGALDCIIAGMSPTAERKETIDFSSNYWVSDLVIIVNKDSEFANATTLADFDGSKIGAQEATFHADALKQIPNVNENILADFTLLYTALTSKTIDGYIAEAPTAFAICQANDTVTYAALKNNDTGFTANEEDTAIAVGVRKNSDLTAEFNKVIDNLSSDDRNALMEKMVELSPAED